MGDHDNPSTCLSSKKMIKMSGTFFWIILDVWARQDEKNSSIHFSLINDNDSGRSSEYPNFEHISITKKMVRKALLKGSKLASIDGVAIIGIVIQLSEEKK